MFESDGEERSESREDQEMTSRKRPENTKRDVTESHTQVRYPGCNEIYQDPSDEDRIRCARVKYDGVKTVVHTKLAQNSSEICAIG
jgi:hypothetical protein